MYKILMVNVDEICLKGRNRDTFWNKLDAHIRSVLKVYQFSPTSKYKCYRDDLRYIIEIFGDDYFNQNTLDALVKIPGIYSILLARKTALDFEKLVQEVFVELDELKEKGLFGQKIKTFKVNTKRAYKRFSMDSNGISRELGHLILERYNSKSEVIKVDLHNPELVILVRVLSGGIYFSTKTLYGIGGLPTGVSGRVLTLLSGGFDSPVASYLMFKRGIEQSFIFFHAYPFVANEVVDKVIEIVKKLAPYQSRSILYVVPFGDIQGSIAKICKPEYRTMLFRRYMIECATILAREIEAEALVTGDSIGQVASQTLSNLALIDRGSEISIFRPLIGFNKLEIINLARKIGTFDISVIPQDDACTLLAYKHPVTKPYRDYWDKFNSSTEDEMNVKLKECLQNSRIMRVDWRGNVYNVNNVNCSNVAETIIQEKLK
ncbi:MAG: tRNA 4-thiouridine(8) synthase ThiI [Oligoflexia bacterium]|nr:tRNA 4-thiouridine(8) synthase ThiI [Oligoflexia bacterium]